MPDTKTALIGTTAGSMSAAALAPTVNWALHGFPAATMPESTPLLISAAILVGLHAAYRWLMQEVPPMEPPVPEPIEIAPPPQPPAPVAPAT